MANLTSYTVSETYKDLLTVLGSTANQGLENTAKRVFNILINSWPKVV